MKLSETLRNHKVQKLQCHTDGVESSFHNRNDILVNQDWSETTKNLNNYTSIEELSVKGKYKVFLLHFSPKVRQNKE